VALWEIFSGMKIRLTLAVIGAISANVPDCPAAA